jgi:hypothetical protein
VVDDLQAEAAEGWVFPHLSVPTGQARINHGDHETLLAYADADLDLVVGLAARMENRVRDQLTGHQHRVSDRPRSIRDVAGNLADSGRSVLVAWQVELEGRFSQIQHALAVPR